MADGITNVVKNPRFVVRYQTCAMAGNARSVRVPVKLASRGRMHFERLIS